jgi:hypothetical protein
MADDITAMVAIMLAPTDMAKAMIPLFLQKARRWDNFSGQILGS